MMPYFVKANFAHDTCLNEWPITTHVFSLHHFLGTTLRNLSRYCAKLQVFKLRTKQRKGKDTEKRRDVQTNLVDSR